MAAMLNHRTSRIRPRTSPPTTCPTVSRRSATGMTMWLETTVETAMAATMIMDVAAEKRQQREVLTPFGERKPGSLSRTPGKKTNTVHSTGTFRYDEPPEGEDDSGRSSGWANADPNMFSSRELAIAQIEAMRETTETN